jgi:exopolysaccharide biosynthesis polyprenyl glycosylphosphotransferase
MGLGRAMLSRDVRVFWSRTLRASVAGLALAGAAFLLVPGSSPGLPRLALLGLGAAGLVLVARPMLSRLGRAGAARDGVLIVGRGDLAARLSLDLLEGGERSERLSGWVPTAGMRRQGQPTALSPESVEALVRSEGISRIVVVEPDAESRRKITAALLECRLLGVEVEDGVDFYEGLHGKIWLDALDPERLVFAAGFRITPGYLYWKRVLDVACALAVLGLGAPLYLLVAALVRLESKGPILFRQERVGQFGRTFTLVKFRSMRVDAEEATGPTWARENDDRVTRLGRILRKFHLDELPQAWNVLKGDLSFVGPRPERPCFVEMLRDEIPFYGLRHYVKPGVTGWAQVRGSYAASIEDSFEKFQYDLWYAKHVSLGLDLEVLALTALGLFRGRGR